VSKKLTVGMYVYLPILLLGTHVVQHAVITAAAVAHVFPVTHCRLQEPAVRTAPACLKSTVFKSWPCRLHTFSTQLRYVFHTLKPVHPAGFTTIGCSRAPGSKRTMVYSTPSAHGLNMLQHCLKWYTSSYCIFAYSYWAVLESGS